MTAPSRIDGPDEALDQTPNLSHSRINRYLTCPEQYRLHYLERLRPKVESGGLVFGARIHLALADLFRSGVDPVETFQKDWESLKEIELHYGKRESWESLREKGAKLLEKFLKAEAPKIRQVESVEKKFELRITLLPLPFVGVADLVAQVNGLKTVVDFKTSGSDYEDHEVVLSDQLTAYWLADPGASRVALCVLVKSKEPKIEWHFAERDAERLKEYLAKVQIVAEDIARGKFYKRPGKHCSYCDFLPACLGDKQKVQEKLVRIT
ncbi:MAG: PD-(D/E)XK nuclease family protein [Deltaproteobacteria bacterium]|nr:PD-(D/E)XK nuclease family protein [Deltaproteobacteria bacterium]